MMNEYGDTWIETSESVCYTLVFGDGVKTCHDSEESYLLYEDVSDIYFKFSLLIAFNSINIIVIFCKAYSKQNRFSIMLCSDETKRKFWKPTDDEIKKMKDSKKKSD